MDIKHTRKGEYRLDLSLFKLLYYAYLYRKFIMVLLFIV